MRGENLDMSSVLPSEGHSQHGRRLRLWVAIVLGVGITARVVRYALRFPLWYDEAALSASLLDRGFLELLRPLDCGQVAPIGYLWSQLAVVKLLGFSEPVLRLSALAGGVASVVLFWRLADRLLGGMAAALAAGMLAVSYPAIRYSAEAKPYGLDLLAAVALVALVGRWLAGPAQSRWLWISAMAVPVALVVSFPAVFVAGGVSVAVAWALAWQRAGRKWWAWAAYNVAALGAFVAVQSAAAANLSQVGAATLQAYWKNAFPPSDSLGALVRWLAASHTGPMLAHPVGGDHGGSIATALLCLAGVWELLRRRQGALLLVLIAPWGLNLVAAALHRYPYGGHVRVAMHLAPSVCLLAGAGLAAVLARLRPAQGANPRAVAAVAVLAALGAGTIVRDVARPARSANDLRARAFAQWFWVSKALDGELVCARSDLHLPFTHTPLLEGDEAIFYCNQRIYSPRHARGLPPQWERVSPVWPLRCVWFRVPWLPLDQEAFDQWLTQMQGPYRLVRRDSYPLPVFNKRGLESANTVEVFEFVPRP